MTKLETEQLEIYLYNAEARNESLTLEEERKPSYDYM